MFLCITLSRLIFSGILFFILSIFSEIQNLCILLAHVVFFSLFFVVFSLFLLCAYCGKITGNLVCILWENLQVISCAYCRKIFQVISCAYCRRIYRKYRGKFCWDILAGNLRDILAGNLRDILGGNLRDILAGNLRDILAGNLRGILAGNLRGICTVPPAQVIIGTPLRSHRFPEIPQKIWI